MLKNLKNRSLTFVSAALLVVGGASAAFAHEGGKGGDEAQKAGQTDADKTERHAKMEQRRADMLAKYDANKDGKLDDSERAAMRADLLAKRFTELDTNKDGVLSKEEFAAQRPGVMARHGHHYRGDKPQK